MTRRLPFAAPALALLLGLPALSSCAYYNTFYLARRNYERALAGKPYPIEKSTGVQTANLTKAIDYSKKVIAQYPKSKWVDDAYVLWARSLLGKDDPLQTVNMLLDYDTRFPRSSLRAEARFYLGVGYRQGHRPEEALRALDEFLARAPRHALVPYAQLERARVLRELERPAEAAAAAGQVLERYPKSSLLKEARIARSEALVAEGEYDRARSDLQYLGLHSADDEERLGYLLREADCLETARRYDDEIALLKDALSHERAPEPPPAPAPTPTKTPSTPVATPPVQVGDDRYGRILMRIGSAHALAGRLDKAFESYREILSGYPRTTLAAEAQYRIGSTYEIFADDFEKARAEYARVKDLAGLGSYALQASQRLSNLDRLMQYRAAAGKDSSQKQVESGFMLAELYLFQLGKPERAVEEYRKIAEARAGTPYAAKALNAEAWVLKRKLDRAAEADSLLWKVVREYPATEAQLAARDYLEAGGIHVPDTLIKLPAPAEAPEPTAADTVRLTPPPEGSMPLGGPPSLGARSDSLLRFRPPGGLLPPGVGPHPDRRFPFDPRESLVDSTARAPLLWPDSLLGPPPPPDSLLGPPAPPDSTRTGSPAPPDTSARPR